MAQWSLPLPRSSHFSNPTASLQPSTAVGLTSSHKFSKLQQASTKELWASIKGNSYTHSSATSTHPLLCDIDAVNQFFAARSFTDNRVITSTPNSTPLSNADTTIYDYEIEPYLRNIRSTSPGPDLVPKYIYHSLRGSAALL